jgi:hypothetical protein
MKTIIERFILGLILAPLTPIAGLLGFWWGSYALLPEEWISICAISGLTLGILADIFIIKKLVIRGFQLGMVFWTIVFLFYSVCLYGFFMGMPVFNAGLAIPAGFIIGGKLAHETADRSQVRAVARRTCFFTTLVLAFVCVTSAILALSEATLPAQLKEMLALPFPVTWGMIWAIILVGGVGLLAINWFLAGLTIRITHRFLSIAR